MREQRPPTSPPTLLEVDYFGDGPPGPAAGVRVADPGEFSLPSPFYSASASKRIHGYAVLGMAAAAFTPHVVADLAADLAVGTWAGPSLPLHVIDLHQLIDIDDLPHPLTVWLSSTAEEDRQLMIAEELSRLGGRVVVNTSLGDDFNVEPDHCAQLSGDAMRWITKVRGPRGS